MKIVVNEKNREKIAEAIRNAEGKATARTITVGAVNMAAEAAERELRGLTKAEKLGSRMIVDDNAQDFPQAYFRKARSVPESTQFELEYTASGWALVNVYRARTKGAYYGQELRLTEEGKAAVIRLVEHMGSVYAARNAKRYSK